MIKKIISTLLKGAYSILAFFNLQLALFVCVAGLIVYLTGSMQNPTIKLAFELSFIFSVILAIVLTIRKLLGIGKTPKKSKGVQIVEEQPVQPQVATVQPIPQPVSQQVIQPSDTPTYYRVKDKKDYVMAEYSDRYELFVITASGLKKVRTDYK